MGYTATILQAHALACHNTYRAECRDGQAKMDTVTAKDETKTSSKKSLKWWQRLWEHDTQQATS
ncbi:MAG: hypothetical protein AAFV93_06835 [Chloroflexota bacterium]